MAPSFPPGLPQISDRRPPSPHCLGLVFAVLFTWTDASLPADTYTSYCSPWKSRNAPNSPLRVPPHPCCQPPWSGSNSKPCCPQARPWLFPGHTSSAQRNTLRRANPRDSSSLSITPSSPWPESLSALRNSRNESGTSFQGSHQTARDTQYIPWADLHHPVSGPAHPTNNSVSILFSSALLPALSNSLRLEESVRRGVRTHVCLQPLPVVLHLSLDGSLY